MNAWLDRMPQHREGPAPSDPGRAWPARLEDGTEVVLRRVPSGPDGPGATLERLRALGEVSHPNLRRVLGAAEFDGALWAITDPEAGLGLDQVVRMAHPLSPAQVTALGLAILGSLEALHRSGFIHGGLTPAAVQVHPDGQVRLGGQEAAVSRPPSPALMETDVRTAGALICHTLGIPNQRDPEEALHESERAAPALAATARAIVAGALSKDAATALVAFQDSAGQMASAGAQASSLAGLGSLAGGVALGHPRPVVIEHREDRGALGGGFQLPDLPWLPIGAVLVGLLLLAGIGVWVVSSFASHPATPPAASLPSPSPAVIASPSPSPAVPILGPPSSGDVRSVAIIIKPDGGTCAIGAACSVRVTVEFKPGSYATLAWDLKIIDSCTGGATTQKGSSVDPQPAWNSVYGDSTFTLPAGHPVAIEAVMTTPTGAASPPLLVSGGSC